MFNEEFEKVADVAKAKVLLLKSGMVGGIVFV